MNDSVLWTFFHIYVQSFFYKESNVGIKGKWFYLTEFVVAIGTLSYYISTIVEHTSYMYPILCFLTFLGLEFSWSDINK